jgi:hypothetical protein
MSSRRQTSAFGLLFDVVELKHLRHARRQSCRGVFEVGAEFGQLNAGGWAIRDSRPRPRAARPPLFPCASPSPSELESPERMARLAAGVAEWSQILWRKMPTSQVRSED